MKKYIKILGNVVTIVAVFFVIKKLWSIDVDYSVLLQKENFLALAIVIIVSASIVACNYMPWKRLVELFSNTQLPHGDCILVYSKSNLLKYVPGNVFQYVGRNSLAVQKNIPHIQVATATLIDVALTVVSAAFISVFFLSDYILEFLKGYQSVVWIVGIILILLLLIVIGFFIFWKEEVMKKLSKYHYVMTKKSIKVILFGLAYYIVVMMISSLMYMIVLIYVLHVPMTTEIFFLLFSAFTLSWLVGFITPGAPAGIGIREAVMMGVTGNIIGLDMITLSMVILRILSIIADVLAFVVILIYNKWISSKKEISTSSK